MGKIAGIKDKSLETYGEKSGQPTISTESATNTVPVLIGSASVSLLPSGPIDAGGSSERIIIMFSGVFQWSYSEGIPSPSTCTVGIYLDGSPTPIYSISVRVLSTTIYPNPAEPTPFSLFYETPLNGAHEVDIRALVGGDLGAYASNGSLVLISTPV